MGKAVTTPKFPQAGWLAASTSKRLKGFTAKAVEKIKRKRDKAKAA